MIGRGFLRGKAVDEADGSGFDSFELRLGDLMRGERATMGKSLLDVQRELKIKAAYIAAIEGADPSAFDTPGFIAGYVRSYARYLNMDPDWAFDTFCQESGFETAHGMAPAASSARPPRERPSPGLGRDIFAGANASFLPSSGFLPSVEPRALGSVLVLAALLGGLGYGGWTVLREVQKVTFAPVEQAPVVVAEVDPLAGGAAMPVPSDAMAPAASPEALDRLYRPEALDVPVLVPRDGPIAALDPRAAAPAQAGGAPPETPASASAAPGGPAGPGPANAAVDAAVAAAMGMPVPLDAPVPHHAPVPLDASGVQVTAGPAPEVQLVAVRESWVRVRAADGSTLFEGILAAGDTFDVPATEEPALLRTGESGALYMAVNGVPYGPVGPAGAVSSNVALSAESIGTTYAVADLAQDAALAEYVAVASAQGIQPGALPPGEAPPPAAAAPDAPEMLLD